MPTPGLSSKPLDQIRYRRLRATHDDLLAAVFFIQPGLTAGSLVRGAVAKRCGLTPEGLFRSAHAMRRVWAALGVLADTLDVELDQAAYWGEGVEPEEAARVLRKAARSLTVAALFAARSSHGRRGQAADSAGQGPPPEGGTARLGA